MSIERFFTDPRRQRSQELALSAERKAEAGALEHARADYAEAARLEEENARDVEPAFPKVRSVLAISAVALWLRAERWDEAARAGCSFLAEPGKLIPDGQRELQKLVDRAWRTSEVEQALGSGGKYIPLEATLSGGLVRQGLAPSTVVAERRDILAPLLIRVAEWRSRKKYRRAGPSALANSYDILEAPAIGASYALRLYVGASSQQLLEGMASPSDVVEHLLVLAGAASAGPDELRELVGDDAYVKAFLRSFRELAPDGKTVGQVDLGAMVPGRIRWAARLTPETRERLTRSLRRQDDKGKPVSCDGILKPVNLRGEEPRIGVDTPDGARYFRIAKGEHDDTIGPKLNRKVRVLGRHEVSEDGEAEDWADDVIPLEEVPPAPAA